MKKTLLNGTLWTDDKDEPIHAHGGCVLKHDGWYYWFGENRRGHAFVSCYKTKDFINFSFCNNVLTAKSKAVDIGKCRNIALVSRVSAPANKDILSRFDDEGRLLCNIERPKVLRNKDGKFVMWMHYENGADYSSAGCAVAVCDTPDGDYTYLGSFNPLGNMSRDCTLYEENGKAYFISAASDNKDLFVYRLIDGFLDVEKHVSTLFPGEEREAPVLFRRNGKTYCITSACTGWRPNQAKWAVAEDIESKFSPLSNFGDKTTFDTQPAFVFSQDEKYIYLADRWGGAGEKYYSSAYVTLEILFDRETPFIEYTTRSGSLVEK